MRNPSGVIPNWDRVILRPEPVAEMSAGGIVLADQTREAEYFAATNAELIDAGEDAWKHPCLKGLKRGMTVKFAKYSASNTFWFVEDVMYMMARAIDVLGEVEIRADSMFQAASDPHVDTTSSQISFSLDKIGL